MEELYSAVEKIDPKGQPNTDLKNKILNTIKNFQVNTEEKSTGKIVKVSKIEVGDILFFSPLVHPILILKINSKGIFYTLLSTKK